MNVRTVAGFAANSAILGLLRGIAVGRAQAGFFGTPTPTQELFTADELAPERPVAATTQAAH